MLPILHGSLLIAVLVAAAWSDVRTARIPNALTAPALLAGVLLCAAQGMLGSSLLAVGLAFALGSALFSLGVLGGGDVKLLMAAGAMLGMGRFAEALVVTAAAGGVLALAVAARRRILLPALLNSKDTLLSLATPARWGEAHATAGVGVPYGVAIAVGSLAAWLT